MNLEDIAKKAGVSRSTVSRVINDDPNVNTQTREHVWHVIRQENFQPNPAARALVRRRTEIIGVAIPTTENIFFTDNDYFTRILAGVSQMTRQRDYAMLLWLGELTDDDERLMQRVSNNRLMDGLVIASLGHDHPLFKRLMTLRQPFVMIDRPLEYDDQISYVSIDNVGAADEATTHLIKLGRRRIAHITGNMTFSDGQDRLDGYKNALRRAGLPIDPNLIAEAYFSQHAGYEAAKRLFPHKPDAIFAADDIIAIGALQAAHEAGIHVPDDLSLVGFDDVDVASKSSPMLTTVRQPVQEKGVAAAKLLIDLIQNQIEGPQRILLKTELIIRESCGVVQRHTTLRNENVQGRG
jgi:LacI family transcriptional regulator